MNNTFLRNVAQRILADNPTELHRVLVLLPSKRGEVFLKRQLSALLSKPALAPAMQTIEEFVQQASGYQSLSQLQLVMELFRVYREKVNADETFDSFLKWSNTLLHDFNEIDRHMIDAYQLFGNLLDAKRIESWGVEPGNETELMNSFLQFWRDLHPLYTSFKENLDVANMSYQGMAYRKVAEDLTLLDGLLAKGYSAIYLLGFNALNAAEEKIFRYLISAKNATALWDADSWYLNDDMHEAGEFLRKYRERWPEFNNKPFEWQQALLAEVSKSIQIISAPSNQGMAQAAGRVLQNFPADDAKNTAVVLADEALLTPLLDAIPAKYEALNITMGMPIQHATLAQDLLTLLRMHEQAERTALSGGAYSYYHRTFLAAIECGLLKTLLGGQEMASLISERVTKYNLVFLKPAKAKEVLAEFSPAHEDFVKLWNQPENAVSLLKVLDEILMRFVADNENLSPLFKEAAFALHQLHEQTMVLLGELNEDVSTATLMRLYQNMLAEHQVDFMGEPLAGLQIMGMLETRTLDFKRVVLTSVNEGILPAGKSQNSFIPYDLKRAFDLPTHHEKDAVYAYHFYRLLQRAEEVYIIYDSDTKGLGGKEKSRFIFQLEQELAQEQSVTVLPEIHLNPEVHASSLVTAPEYAKDEAVLQRLRELATKGFSPSALAAYLRDPVAFYIDRLLKVDEADEVAETIGYDVLGNVVHKSLEKLYTPLINQLLDKDELEQKLKDAPDVVRHYLAHEYKGNLKQGRNLLISKVALHMVEVAIKNDIERVEQGEELVIAALEQAMEVKVEVPGLDFQVVFKGLADRIDHVGLDVFILDYKTGTMEARDVSADNLETIFESENKTKAFQVLFYAWLYAKQNGLPTNRLEAGIFSTRKPGDGIMRFGLGKGSAKQNEITEELLIEFEEQLFKLVRELFEATKPFAPRLSIIEET